MQKFFALVILSILISSTFLLSSVYGQTVQPNSNTVIKDGLKLTVYTDKKFYTKEDAINIKWTAQNIGSENITYDNFIVKIIGNATEYDSSRLKPSEILLISPDDTRVKKFDSDVFYGKILSLIKLGETRSYGIIMIVSDQNKITVEDILKTKHHATNVFAGERLSFVTAQVPLQEIPKLADYDVISLIGDGEQKIIFDYVTINTLQVGQTLNGGLSLSQHLYPRYYDKQQVIPSGQYTVQLSFAGNQSSVPISIDESPSPKIQPSIVNQSSVPNSLTIDPDIIFPEMQRNEAHELHGQVFFAGNLAKDVFVTMSIENPDGSFLNKHSETQTDKDGNYNFSIFIPQDSALGTYTVSLNATISGYASTSMQYYFWITNSPTLDDYAWKITKVFRDKNEFQVPYRITSGNVHDMESKNGSFFLYLDSYSEGLLEIAIPRNLIEPDLKSIYDEFTPLVDGYYQHSKETDSECFRTFTIQLFQNAKTVEIITAPDALGPKYQTNIPEKCNNSATYAKFSEKKPSINKISNGVSPNISEISKLPLKFYVLHENLFYENNDYAEQTFRIPYKLYNANLEFIGYNSGTITIGIDNKDTGTMQIAIPNNILESEKPEQLNDFSLSIDGHTSDFHSLKTPCYREFTFELPKNSNEILLTHNIQSGSRLPYVNPLNFPANCITGDTTPSSQILSGKLPSEIGCYDKEMIPFKRLSEDEIVCVTQKTAEVLVKRNWGNYPIDLKNGQTWVELYPVLCHKDLCAIRSIWEESYLSGELQPTLFEGTSGYDIETTSKLIIESYKKQGIKIYDVKFEQNNPVNCDTKGCLDPYTLKLLINDSDLNKMNGYSFEIFEKYRP